jgi:hypothetical protein
MRKLSLAAVVQVVRGAKRPGVRVAEMTCVTVTLGNAHVAVATVAGRYDAAGAVKEFTKTWRHPRWKRLGGWDTAVLAGFVPGATAGLAAAA